MMAFLLVLTGLAAAGLLLRWLLQTEGQRRLLALGVILVALMILLITFGGIPKNRIRNESLQAMRRDPKVLNVLQHVQEQAEQAVREQNAQAAAVTPALPASLPPSVLNR